MEESKIIKLFVKRSEKGLREFKKEYNAYIYRISANILSDIEDVEECLNDVYMKLWETIPPVVPKSLIAYAGKLTRNISLDRYRLQNTKKRKNNELSVVLDELSEIVIDSYDMENVIVNKLMIRRINQYLSGLTKEKRVLFVMRYYYSYSIKEISKHFSMNESTVKMTLMRVRRQLVEVLEEEGMTYE